MICIKSIEVVEVPGDWMHLVTRSYPTLVDLDPNARPEELSVVQELVRGVRFRNGDDREVVIGASKQVQDALGLPFEVFKNMNDELSKSLRSQSAAHSKIKRIEGMGLWGRVKSVFTGIHDPAIKAAK